MWYYRTQSPCKASRRFPLVPKKALQPHGTAIITVLSSSACRAPLLANRGEVDFTLNFIMRGQNLEAVTSSGAGSRLLLSTAVTLTVTLTANDGSFDERTKTVSLAGTPAAGTVPVGFTEIPMGEYTVKADATDATGAVLFTQASPLTVSEANASVTLNLVPVSATGLPSLILRNETAAYFPNPGNNAVSWIVPAATLTAGKYAIEFTATIPPMLQIFAQAHDGTVLRKTVFDSVLIIEVPDSEDSFITFYNTQAMSCSFSLKAAEKIIYSSQGLSTWTLPSLPTNVMVKAWGAGGGGSSFYYANSPSYSGIGNGGAGGFAYSAFSAAASQTLSIVVGAGGNQTVLNTSVPALGGTGNGTGGAGGGGSLVALWDGSSYSLRVCAGGGGGASGQIYEGGAGGGSSGQGTYGPGGSNGTGGNGGSGVSGANMVLTSGVLPGLIGNGGNAANPGSGGGGGGYGGGSAPGYSGYKYPGAGGGGYALGTGSYLTAGTGTSVANTSDPDYITGAGNCGSAATPGNDGLVVITITY